METLVFSRHAACARPAALATETTNPTNQELPDHSSCFSTTSTRFLSSSSLQHVNVSQGSPRRIMEPKDKAIVSTSLQHKAQGVLETRRGLGRSAVARSKPPLGVEISLGNWQTRQLPVPRRSNYQPQVSSLSADRAAFSCKFISLRSRAPSMTAPQPRLKRSFVIICALAVHGGGGGKLRPALLLRASLGA